MHIDRRVWRETTTVISPEVEACKFVGRVETRCRKAFPGTRPGESSVNKAISIYLHAQRK
jgi:hypothetical protein